MLERFKYNADGTERQWHINGLTYTAVGLATLFAFLVVGDFTWSLKDRSVGMITKLLFKQFGASDFLNGLLIVSLPSALGMIVGPVVSYRSDRHRGRLGRRIPYLLVTTPIAVLGMVGLAFSPALGGWFSGWIGNTSVGTEVSSWLGATTLGVNNVTLVCLGLFWMVFEFAMLIANSVFNAFINDVVPSQLLGRFYGLFRIVSLLAGILFSWYLLGWVSTHSMWLFLGLAVIYGGGMLLMCCKVREGTYPPPPELPPNHSKFKALTATKTYFRECFSNPYYILVFFALLMLNKGFLPVNTYLVFYAADLGIPLKRYGEYISYSFMISFVLAFPIGALVDRFHPLRCCIVTVVLYLVTVVLSGIFVSGETSFALALIGHSVASGAYMTASASLPLRLLPRDRFAQFNSAAGIVSTCSNIVAVPLFGLVLDLTGNNYRYLFWFAAALSLIGIGIGLWLYRRFSALGGVKNYVAPSV